MSLLFVRGMNVNGRYWQKWVARSSLLAKVVSLFLKVRVDMWIFFAMPPLPRGEALDVEYAFKSVEEMEAFQRSIVCDSKGDVNE